MGLYPGGQIGESVRRLELESQRLGELLLPTGALEVDDHLARDSESGSRPVILFNHRQREVNAGRDPRGRIEVSDFEEQSVYVQPELGKSSRHIEHWIAPWASRNSK